MEFRKGDVVSVEGVVEFMSAGQVYVRPKDSATFAVLPDLLRMVQPFIEVGDLVRSKHDGRGLRYDVIAISGEECWLKRRDNGNHVTLRLRDIEPEKEGEAPTAIPGGVGTWVPPPQPQAKGEVPEPSLDVVNYTVVEGDTLIGIANSFDTSVAAIASRNKIADPDMIVAGQVLEIQDERIPF